MYGNYYYNPNLYSYQNGLLMSHGYNYGYYNANNYVATYPYYTQYYLNSNYNYNFYDYNYMQYYNQKSYQTTVDYDFDYNLKLNAKTNKTSYEYIYRSEHAPANSSEYEHDSGYNSRYYLDSKSNSRLNVTTNNGDFLELNKSSLNNAQSNDDSYYDNDSLLSRTCSELDFTNQEFNDESNFSLASSHDLLF